MQLPPSLLTQKDAADFLKRGTNQDEKTESLAPFVVEVFPEYWMAQKVFSRCQPGLVAGYGAVVWRGLAATEIEAAANMLLVPRKKRPQLIVDVQEMGAFAADYLSKKKG